MAFLDVTGFTVKHMLNLILMESADMARGGYECSFKINLEMLCGWDTFYFSITPGRAYLKYCITLQK